MLCVIVSIHCIVFDSFAAFLKGYHVGLHVVLFVSHLLASVAMISDSVMTLGRLPEWEP